MPRVHFLVCCFVVLAVLAGASVSARGTLVPLAAAPSGYHVVYAFRAGYDGLFPNSVIEVDGTLYGTTQNGGSPQPVTCPDRQGCGTIFELSTAGVERILYRFPGKKEHGGDFPVSLTSFNDRVYGSTIRGGKAGTKCCGTVFALRSLGDVDYLYDFKGGADGSFGSSTIDVGGTLFGTTFYGGRSGLGCSGDVGCGTVFTVTTSGVEHVVYRFKGAPDGAEPSAIAFGNPTVYGTTLEGGTGRCPHAFRKGCGTVFAIDQSGAEHIVYSFKNGADGAVPASLLDVGGTLYGTTNYGGSGACSSSFGPGCGTVFEIDKGGAERILYTFKGGLDGSYPGALTEFDGALYGTTLGGGTGCSPYGCGTVFKLTASGTKMILHRLLGGTDGASPSGGPLTVLNGMLYGTTTGGGACSYSTNGCGVVFSVAP